MNTGSSRGDEAQTSFVFGVGYLRSEPRYLGCYCLAGFLALGLLLPNHASGHGAILIQIGEVTKQIEAATNNLGMTNVGELYFQRAELRRADKTYEVAEPDYLTAETLLKTEPLLATIYTGHANMLAEAERLKDSLALFDQTITRWPQTAEAYIGRARVQSRLNQRQSAIKDYEQGLHLAASPDKPVDVQPEWFLELAKLQSSAREPNAALRTLDSGIKRFGPLVMLQLEAIELELAGQRTDAALKRLDAIIKTAPRKETWYAKRGDILLAAKRGEEARQAYERSLHSVRLLPNRLQQNPPMQKLVEHIQAALQSIQSPASNSLAQTN
jgi:tetratricopeptide (TPR) repeat protein